MRALTVLFTTSLATTVAAQPAAPAPVALPDNEIFAASLARVDGAWRLGAAENLTMRKGYDNQPAFLPDGRGFLYTADGEGQQTDVHLMTWPERVKSRVASTPTSEYSPTPIDDGKSYTTVVVEADGVQRLWQYRIDGTGGFVLLPELRGVGYHAWLTPERVALFMVGDEASQRPSALHVADVKTGKVIEIATGIGRSLHRVPGSTRLSWVDKRDAKTWHIVASDGLGGEIETLVETLPETEDYAWLPDGSILMAKGREVYRWSGERGKGFELLATVADIPGSINRLAVSPAGDTLVFVVTVELPRTRGIRG